MILPSIVDAKKRGKVIPKVYYDMYDVSDKIKSLLKDKTYYIETYGCQMNVHDGENIKAIMEDIGLVENSLMEDADVIILNTCAIRENAHNKVFGMLGRIKHLKETRPEVMTVLCGCMAQEESVALELKNKYKWVDVVMGTHNIYDLPNLLEEAIVSQKQNIEVFSIEGDIIEGLPVKRDSNCKAWVNIMYGCDKFCTYCIVPYTRGTQRSRKQSDILLEVEELYNNNYKEVTLLGQNVNAYGKDLNDNYDMADLLRDVAKTNIARVRFVTSHPWDFTDKMIEVIKEYPNIMPYIHLPIQSGSDRILKLMGRKYTIEKYIKLFNNIKNNIPNVSITTDIIVGFPGETEEDFQKTLDIYNTLKFDLAYTFIYSPREGTPASVMEDNTSIHVKEERLYKLNDLVNKYALEHNKEYQDKVYLVLLDSKSNKEGYLSGYTETMKLVNVKSDIINLGNIVKVKITDVKTWSMDGEIIND